MDDSRSTCAWILCENLVETYTRRRDAIFCSPTCGSAARHERYRYEAFCTGVYAIRRQARPAPASRPESAGRRTGRPPSRRGAERAAGGSASLF